MHDYDLSQAFLSFMFLYLVAYCLHLLRYNINWNYGLLPQTWEDPSSANAEVEGAFGDNDPGILVTFPTIHVIKWFKLISFFNLLPEQRGKHIKLQLAFCLKWFLLNAVDVVEIGDRRANIGEVLKVKPLAALAMIDEGELDWKIVAISLDDPRASLVNDVDDAEKHFPVCLFLFSFLECLWCYLFNTWSIHSRKIFTLLRCKPPRFVLSQYV